MSPGTDTLVPVPVPPGVPPELGITGPRVQWLWEQIGDSGDEVHRILEPGRPDRFLKTSARAAEGRMANERARMLWLQGTLPVPEVLAYAVAGGKEWLVVSAIPGLSACHPHLALPRDSVVRQMARWLRRIHSLPREGCPFVRTLADKLADAAATAPRRTPEERERLARFLALPPPAEDPVVIHGDYCEPNIIFDGGTISGFIDLGYAGMSDRYSDFCQAAYTLNRNGDGALIDFFFSEYGPPALDRGKLDFYMELEGWF